MRAVVRVTLVNLALAWAEEYISLRPEVRISVTGGGSGTGIAAMINGTVDIANASRAMKTEEIDAAKANGITPIELVVARARAVAPEQTRRQRGHDLDRGGRIGGRAGERLARGQGLRHP